VIVQFGWFFLSVIVQGDEVLRKIEREVQMREGAGKLLVACSRMEQALEAAKSLLTSNARILALLSQLQQIRKDQVFEEVRRNSGGLPIEEKTPCLGTLVMSDLRIPLMWKDTEYFSNKGEVHRCATFCLLQCGTEIQDTDLVMVDKTLTDICFEEPIVFNNVGPGFLLRVQLYSSFVMEETSTGTLGSRRGSRICAALGSAAVWGSVFGGDSAKLGSGSPPPSATLRSPKYCLLAQTTLKLQHVQEGFKSHDLSLAATEDDPFWVPLYGNICCRLLAQPFCMSQPIMSGQLQILVLM
uniref:Rhotekin b n=1 Tax=Tetraodon nigroviridis TaxID=99883 RepID=H3D7G0_TETNG